MDADLHPTPVRLAARLVDPDAYVICAAMLKAHNVVVATLSVKHMCLGAPLRRRSERGVQLERQAQVSWRGAADASRDHADGYEGMEGNRPASGTRGAIVRHAQWTSASHL